MNAYELADELFNYLPSYDAEKFATMLRQQQAEIEALKRELDRAVENYTDKAIENEALMEGGVVCARCGAIAFDPVITQTAKTLTDEEITEVLNDENIAEYHQGNWLVLPYAFARAILRKAQEK